MGKNKSVVCKICYRVMRSDKLNRHMKRHDEPVEIEPLQSVAPIKREKFQLKLKKMQQVFIKIIYNMVKSSLHSRKSK